MSEVIIAHGDDEFVRSVNSLSSAIRGKVIPEVTQTAAELVFKTARPLVPVDTGEAASTLAMVSMLHEASVEGGEGIEYYGWLEYGGDSGRQHATHRPVIAAGRYIEPSGVQQEDQINKEMVDVLVKAARSVGLEVTRG